MNAPEIILTVFGTPIILIIAGVIYVVRDGKGDRQSGDRRWFGSPRFQTALTARYGPRKGTQDVTGPVAAVPAAPPAGPVTPNLHDRELPNLQGSDGPVVEHHQRAHAVEIHPVQHFAAAAWAHVDATPNQAKGSWPGTSNLQPLPEGFDSPWPQERSMAAYRANLNAATPVYELPTKPRLVLELPADVPTFVAAGENRRQGNWPMGDRADFTESAWTKRDSAFLHIRLAEEALDGFDHIVDYATSGIQARWAS